MISHSEITESTSFHKGYKQQSHPYCTPITHCESVANWLEMTDLRICEDRITGVHGQWHDVYPQIWRSERPRCGGHRCCQCTRWLREMVDGNKRIDFGFCVIANVVGMQWTWYEIEVVQQRWLDEIVVVQLVQPVDHEQQETEKKGAVDWKLLKTCCKCELCTLE